MLDVSNFHELSTVARDNTKDRYNHVRNIFLGMVIGPVVFSSIQLGGSWGGT